MSKFQAYNKDLNISCPLTCEFLIKAGERKYKIFESNLYPYNLNIVGWRSKIGRVNKYDDFLALYWFSAKKEWNMRSWSITTKPGTPWLLKPINPNGAAVLVPGQYIESYERGIYKNKTALLQRKPVNVYRDNDLDNEIDITHSKIDKGYFGIHIHRGGKFSNFVNRNSAGCQVFKNANEFDEFFEIIKLSSMYWGPFFTYTLLEF